MNHKKDFLDSEEESLIGRYEEMLEQGRPCYFDVSECEDIIDYYGERYELKKAMQAVSMAEQLHPLSLSIQLIKASLLAFGSKPRKALSIIERLDRSEVLHDFEFLRLNLAKAYALLSIGKIKEGLAPQLDILKNNAIESVDREQAIALITAGLLAQDKSMEAVQNLLNIEKKIPLSPVLMACMASACMELDDVEMAVDYYKKAIEQNPFDPVLWCSLADILDDADEGVKAYDYALLLDEKMVSAYVGKAELLNEQGKLDEAGALLRKGLEVCPYDVDLYDMLVEHYEEKQDYDSAMECCNKMISKDPYDPQPWLSFARVCSYMERYEEALEACDAVIQLDKDLSAEAYEAKASIYMAMGWPDKELEMLQKMLKCDVHDLAMASEVGMLYESRGEMGVAHQIYAAAIDANPDEPQLHLSMAMLLSNMNKPEEAYCYALRAMELDNQDANVWFVLASLQQKRGEPEEMLRSLKRSLTRRECSVGAIVMLYKLIVEDKMPGAASLLKYAEKCCMSASVAHPHYYMAALHFYLRDMEKCLVSLWRAMSMDADCSLKVFFEICPKAKKVSEIKKLRHLYEQISSE
ncbi:MAG: tetratricopeptide repeat protein [Prevotellaceae bacterium]|jgi:tetratricopeptide (TPR) repeat protein|nr:tetratricopeptide repeat protein [Prevotellaceae bacterium]